MGSHPKFCLHLSGRQPTLDQMDENVVVVQVAMRLQLDCEVISAAKMLKMNLFIL